ncbi:hypothetical protein VP1G_10171 [Cytospora mali]|uniref:Acetyltransferase BOT5 n=1 Tax=Cytospora mali TaxID=578113 RepID=A0A194VGA5_CYTMA|nr:hypothetical protein VP1G_10171 [Valsa mali var. pyri (nom. inval.)]
MALNFLRAIFGRGKLTRPARVPTDEVLPLHEFDGRMQVRSIIMGWTMRFDDILDADKLNTTLCQLLEIGAWRKLGGRLREREDGKLEIHVPAEFTPKRPALRFSHVTLDMDIWKHPLGSRLPTPTNGGSVQDGADNFEEFAAPEDAPRSLEDFLTRDVAQLGLHVISFTDATIVSITWPHTMSDALGLTALVTNWAKVLAGKEDEVVPLLGVEDDPLATVGKGEMHETEEPWALRSQILGSFGWVRFILTMLWDAIRIGQCQQHMIYLPARSMQKLRETAMNDLAATMATTDTENDWHPQNIPDGRPFLTENDVLTAWMTRLAAHSLGPRSNRSIAFLNFFEVRSRLPSVFQPAHRAAYVGNFIFASWAHISALDAQKAPLGIIALRYRALLAAQTTEGQIRGLLRTFRERLAVGKRIGTMRHNSMMVTCTNWTKAKLFDVVDLGPAVVRRGTPFWETEHKPGRPVYYHAVNLRPLSVVKKGGPPKVGTQNGVNILGKDAGGNYWIMAILPPKSWPRIEDELADM